MYFAKISMTEADMFGNRLYKDFFITGKVNMPNALDNSNGDGWYSFQSQLAVSKPTFCKYESWSRPTRILSMFSLSGGCGNPSGDIRIK